MWCQTYFRQIQLSMFFNQTVCVNKFFKIPTAVCRACTRKTLARYAEMLVFVRTIFVPKRESGFAGTENLFDLCFRKNPCKIVRYCVFYTRISRTFNLTTFKHIPKRYSVPVQKINALRNSVLFLRIIVCIHKGFAEYLRKNLPKPVLRMHIEKTGFTAFGRRHCSENQNSAFAVPDRFYFVHNNIRTFIFHGCLQNSTQSGRHFQQQSFSVCTFSRSTGNISVSTKK